VAIRRRRRRARRFIPSLLASGLFLVGAWWAYDWIDLRPAQEPSLTLAPIPVLTTDRPDVPEPGPKADVPEKGDTLTARADDPPSTAPGAQEAAERIRALLETAKAALARGEMVPARQYFSEALQLGPDDPERTLLRAELTRLGNETIFSARIYEDDPFIERYIIQPGDTMGKIAKANHVTPELLAEINGIRNVNLIRAGQTIKVIKGPFRAVVDSRTYTLGVYLQNTFVKQFKVGLGADQSTPTGEWRVGTKLVNPTYYPPRSGQVIAADDPANPLGERWIALHGVSGEAAGQLRYGIHGTVEPDSIGKSVSLGCIRLYNEDVEALYNYLVEKESTVIVR
jgi:lipoprotein-anchoring transpeptidase ErfK/SrfK